jgi:hypothetical protein
MIWPDKIRIKITVAVKAPTNWQLLFKVQRRKVEARDTLNDLEAEFTSIMKNSMKIDMISEVLSAIFTGTTLTGGNTAAWMLFISTQQTGARNRAAPPFTGVKDCSGFQTRSGTIQPWLGNNLFLFQLNCIGTLNHIFYDTELVAFFTCSTALNVMAASLD